MTQLKVSDDQGRLDRPPAPTHRVEFPPSFGRRFAVFVDTEEEFDWSRPTAREGHGTSAGRSLPEVQSQLFAAGVRPTYVIDYPIATDPTCAAILRDFQDRGECAVGTHLHPWVNPPFEDELTPANSFAGNLTLELERSKLLSLTEAIEAAMGRRPTVYRAGRYGVGPNTARLLEEAGYEADVSVRPLHDYSAEGGPDFRGFDVRPYWVGGGSLLEVPLTAAFLGGLRRLGNSLYKAAGRVPRGHGILSRAGLLNRVPLTPEGVPVAEAREAIERLLDDGLRLFSISFHSPSAAPGHTPYVRDSADLATFYAWWDGVFELFARRGVEPAAMDEILAAARASRTAAV